jgi:hypothetical protein
MAIQMRVILHVGLHKTGTSSLQRAFFRAIPLLRQQGIAYVLSDLRGGIAHHELIEAAAQKNASTVDRYLREIQEQSRGVEQVLISSERMSDLDEDALSWWKAQLDRTFQRPTYAVWVFGRRPSTLIPSRWHGYIRRGGRENLPAYTLDCINSLFRSNRLPFEPVFERFADVYGRSTVHVASMEKLIASGEDLVVSAFKRMFDIDSAELRGLRHWNTSLGPGEAEMLRALSMRYALTGASARSFIRPLLTLLRHGDNVFSDGARMFEPYFKELRIDDRSDAFLAIERGAVERVGDRLETWGDGTIFGPEKPKSPIYVSDEYWLDEKVRQKLNELYSRAEGMPPARAASRRQVPQSGKAFRSR